VCLMSNQQLLDHILLDRQAHVTQVPHKAFSKVATNVLDNTNIDKC